MSAPTEDSNARALQISYDQIRIVTRDARMGEARQLGVGDGYAVHGFNGGARAGAPDRFANRRAEAYWTLARRLEAGEIALPEDEELATELLAIRWRPTPEGRVRIEAKDNLRGRLGRSPDRADAVSMAFAYELRPVWEEVHYWDEVGGFVY